MQRAALFDLDDTLHDRAAAIPVFISFQARRLLAMQASDAIRFAERFVDLEQRGRVWKDQVYQDLGREFPQAQHASERLLKDYLHSFPKSCRLREGAAELLRKLRENAFKLAIVTNGRSDMQLAVVNALELGGLVDAVVISELVGLRKPNPQIFEDALTRIGVEAKSAVFVGDDLQADVRGASSAGFQHVYWFDTGIVAPIDLPSGISRVRNFAELSGKMFPS